MTKKTRFAGLLVALIMTLTIVPTQTVRADFAVSGYNLEAVDVQPASSPLGGQTLGDIAGKSIVTSSYSSYYTVDDAAGYWTNSKKEKMGGGDKFVQGGTYYYTIVLRVAELYKFDQNIHLSIGGLTGNVDSGAKVKVAADQKTATFKNAYKVTCGKVTDQINIASVELSDTIYYYNGKTHKPKATVYDSFGNKVESSGYTLKYSNGSSKKVGVYKVTAKGKVEYTGEATATYSINPSAPRSVKAKGAKKKVTVSWKAPSSGKPEAYDVFVYSDKACKKIVTSAKVSGTKKTIGGLKAKKVYYVKVDCYTGSDAGYLVSKSSKAVKVRTK